MTHRLIAAREPTGRPAPVWWVIMSRELRDLWVGGKGLVLILLYTVLLGIYAFLLASNNEVNLLPLKEMILEVVKAGIAVCLLMTMVIAADSITSERERLTLESLLLTPASRRQIVLGKYLSAISPIPIALLLTVPYLFVLSKGNAVFGDATLWLFVIGGLIVPALAAIGMLASIWSNTTKTSMLVTIALYLLMLLPAEIIRPGKVMTASELRKSLLIQALNPLDAINKYLGRVVVLDAPPAEHWWLLSMPAAFGGGVLLLLFGVAGPRLRLAGTGGWRLRALTGRAPSAAAPRIATPAVSTSAPRRDPAAGDPPAEEVFTASTPESLRASATARARLGKFEPSGSAASTWSLVFKRELRDLWVGGKALNLTIAYAVLLGGYSYWLAHDSSLSLIPPKEMVFELMKVAFMVSVFMGLIIGADTLSGERDRSTLEGLLLTPTSRLQIVSGKFLAAASTWPAALVLTVPYQYVLAQGDEVFGQALMWGAIIGTILAPAFTALGMFVSFWCASNKSSMFVSLGIYLVFLLPTQLPGHAQGGFMGLLFQALNPMAGTRHFLAGMLVNNRTPAEYSEFMVSAVVFAILMFVLLFAYAGPALRLEAGRERRWGGGRAAAAVLLIGALLGLAAPSSLWAQAAQPQGAVAAAGDSVRAPAQVTEAPIRISIDKSDTVFRAGTPLLFNTVVTNAGGGPSQPIIVAMNIINLNKQGEVVDPEDWSPQRTQYVEPLSPGQSATQSWRVNAILDGDFMVYMVAIPAPTGRDATSQPVASSGIHLTVTPYTKLNPGGVLPYAIGGPLVLGLIMTAVYRRRRRQIDLGG